MSKTFLCLLVACKFVFNLRPFVFTIMALLICESAFPFSISCHEEIQTYCSDVKPGEGRWTRCAIGHRDQYSVSCRTEVHAVIEQRPLFTLFCKESVARFCPNIKAGKGRLYNCMKFNEDNLPLSCKQQIS